MRFSIKTDQTDASYQDGLSLPSLQLMEAPDAKARAFVFRHKQGGTRVEFLDTIAKGRKHTRKAVKDHQPLEEYLKNYIARREVSGWTCTPVTISKGWLA
jgi:hypothetical protein